MRRVTAVLKTIGELSPDEQKQFTEWAWGQKDRVNFDRVPLGYPRACIVTARRGGDITQFVPVHPVLLCEAMLGDLGLNKGFRAEGLYRIGQELERAARETGMYEIYSLCNDKDEIRAIKKRGWEIVLFDADQRVWLIRRRVK